MLRSLLYEILPYPPYFPDISPTYYRLFKYFELLIPVIIFLNEKSIDKTLEYFILEKKKSRSLKIDLLGRMNLVEKEESNFH